MRLQCAHCNYIWNYRGSHNFWATCPQCRYKVRIIQKPMTRPEEETRVPEIKEEIEDKRVVKIVDAFLRKHGHSKNSLIHIMLDIQQSFGWFPKEVLSEVSRQLDVPYGHVCQVATFLKANSSSGFAPRPPETARAQY